MERAEFVLEDILFYTGSPPRSCTRRQTMWVQSTMVLVQI